MRVTYMLLYHFACPFHSSWYTCQAGYLRIMFFVAFLHRRPAPADLPCSFSVFAFILHLFHAVHACCEEMVHLNMVW